MKHETYDNQLDSLRTAVMTVPEKDALRGHVRGFVALNPSGALRKSWLARRAFVAAGIAVLVLATGTGAFAHYARPGNPFYPIKLVVNDRIEVALAGDADARLDKELELQARALDDEEDFVERELISVIADDGIPATWEELEEDTSGDDLEADDEDADDESPDDASGELLDLEREFREMELEAELELAV